MNTELLLISAVVLVMIILFIWGKWRYDVISIITLALAGSLGIIPIEKIFAGFSHEAVIIVGSMFVLSRGMINSGIIDSVTRKLAFLAKHPALQLLALTIIVTFLSAFINNVGALALVVPIAIHLAKKSSVSVAMFLLPLAFASHLGGYLTLIGSPRNIIISAFRENAGFAPYKMFDFSYVGIGVVLVGIIFLTIIGWRLIPKRKTRNAEAFEVKNYVAELKVLENSKIVGKYFHELKKDSEHLEIIMLVRVEEKIPRPSKFEIFRPGDILLIESDPETLKEIAEINELELMGEKSSEKNVGTEEDDIRTQEAVVVSNSAIIGRTWKQTSLSLRFGVNLFAVARQGEELREQLEDIQLKAGDLLILHGRKQSIEDTISHLSLLPLAQRELTLGRRPRGIIALSIFTLAIIIATFGWLPLSIVFLIAVLTMFFSNLISLRQAYESIDWPVLILLGGMLSVGLYLADVGAPLVIASGLSFFTSFVEPMYLLLAILVFSIILSDFVNATASSVLMAPVAIIVAQTLGASIDPFLMAVAIGSSCAFLTPTGHESNTMVMGPGGYKFSDYFKVGLPLEILIIAISLPLILHFWPMF